MKIFDWKKGWANSRIVGVFNNDLVQERDAHAGPRILSFRPVHRTNYPHHPRESSPRTKFKSMKEQVYEIIENLHLRSWMESPDLDTSVFPFVQFDNHPRRPGVEFLDPNCLNMPSTGHHLHQPRQRNRISCPRWITHLYKRWLSQEYDRLVDDRRAELFETPRSCGDLENPLALHP